MATNAAVPTVRDSRFRSHTLMILSILFGCFGLDRIYNRQLGWGIVKLITLGGIGIWWVIDAVYFTYKAGQIT